MSDLYARLKMGMAMGASRKVIAVPLVILQLVLIVSAALVALLLMLTMCDQAPEWSDLMSDSGSEEQRSDVHGGQIMITRGSERGRESHHVVPHDVALALLHFATTKEVPQQSREEIATTLTVLLHRAPCNFLVFGMWHDSLLWATFNHGGRTAFVDESQEWIDRMKVRHPELETYKLDYKTSLQDAPDLISEARASLSTACRPHQELQKSDCSLAMNQLPTELLSVEWDVIMIDGPRSYPTFPSFPGRMSPIFTSAVMAHTRAASGYTDIFLHDVSRPLERQFGEEFLCRSNLVESVGDLWHFQVHSSNMTQFCADQSLNRDEVIR